MDVFTRERLLDQFESNEEYDLRLSEELAGLTGMGIHAGSLVVDEQTGANIFAFTSGFGDGVYPSFFGLDDEARLVSLVTDFGVIQKVITPGV